MSSDNDMPEFPIEVAVQQTMGKPMPDPEPQIAANQNSRQRTCPGLLPDIQEIRAVDFPLLVNTGRIYLDSTATSQEPQSVKNRMHLYRSQTIRGSNHSKNSTEAREAQYAFEEVRQKLIKFFHAQNYIVGFTGGTTDSSNWVATRFPFKRGDLLVLTDVEHNSQIVTARNMARRAGADVAYVPANARDGRIDLNALRAIVNKRKKGNILLDLVHVSNVTGIINPVKEIRNIIGKRGFIYLDMAQSAGHIPIDLDLLDIDFAGVSSHKMYGPMGIGALFINKKSERYITNCISGGSAVKLVSRWLTAYADGSARLEPGTQDLEGAIEWGYAIDYLANIGMDRIEAHDKALADYFIGELQKIKGIRIYGPPNMKNRTAVITFTGKALGMDHERIAQELDQRGISVRDGCFCAHLYVSQQLGAPAIVHEARTAMMKLGLFENLLMLPGAVRVSFAFYNTIDEAHMAVEAIGEIMEK